VAVALIGFLLLGISTIPVAWRRCRLERDLAQLRSETVRQEQRLRRTEQALHASRRDTFARERALRSLLLPPPQAQRPASR
jgi:hypothetical protein